MKGNLVKYLIWILIAATIIGGGYLIYQYYKKQKQAPSIPQGTSGAGAASAGGATNTTSEPDWSKLKIPHTYAEMANVKLEKKIPPQTGDMILVLQRYLNDTLGYNGNPATQTSDGLATLPAIAPSPLKLKYDGSFGTLTEEALVKATNKKSILWSQVPGKYIPQTFYTPKNA